MGPAPANPIAAVRDHDSGDRQRALRAGKSGICPPETLQHSHRGPLAWRD